MNSIILDNEKGIISDKSVLNHLHQNLKLQTGDSVQITILNQGIGTGIVKQLTADSCHIEVKEIQPAMPNWIDLIVGVSRPQTTKKVLEHGSTMGVNSFHFYRAELSEKSYLDSKVFTDNESNELKTLGLAQSTIYSKLPTHQLYTYNPAKNFESIKQKFVLDLEGTETFAEQNIDFSQPIVLSVGPERGFTRFDLDHFTKNGFKSIKISKTTLRVEHAVYFAISQLEMLKMNKKENIC